MSFYHFALVGIGGFFGSMARFAISRKYNSKEKSLPTGTIIVNLSGAFLLGLLTGAHLDQKYLLFAGTGFMGAFTTFSTLKLETIQLHIGQKKKAFFLYIGITYFFGILLACLGYLTGKNL
ncbi:MULTISPECIES: CrcB family protein [Bacillus]|uniref:Fluoride-specific ion channel FluC n=1 Tax=Bacillus infantis NRRL B-14911 TaxID=1367477 RepID=U5LCZ7_9BACI|nr:MULTISPECIES: CrcB family protein [Bacillus]AGX04611.1 chromosome condensation protein CrcB [Bacillus infantis NRRL B-14911]EAR68321.1 camphor resistance protein CrcB [Bacillus sp. NRRL B-14911]